MLLHYSLIVSCLLVPFPRKDGLIVMLLLFLHYSLIVSFFLVPFPRQEGVMVMLRH